MKTRQSFGVIAALILSLGAAAAGCGSDDDSGAAPATATDAVTATDASTTDASAASDTPESNAATSTIVETTTTKAATTTEVATSPPETIEVATTSTDVPVGTTEVNVYWGWSVANPGAGAPERIGAGGRSIAADVPVRNALDELLEGPDTTEQEVGMVSSVPAGTQVLGISIDGDTATVDLSGEFDEPGGTLDEAMRLAQVVFTVTQFDGFERVKFNIDSEPQDPVLSHGVQVGDGLTRDDMFEVRPIILVEQPVPGADVTDPLTIRGESNTFESTVRYAVTAGGGDGVVIDEGFTTATAGMGTWGDFDIVVDLSGLDGYEAGPGSVIVWEDSPRDGSRVDLVEIPVVLPVLG